MDSWVCKIHQAGVPSWFGLENLIPNGGPIEVHMMPKVVEGGCGGHEQIFLYRFETLQILINIQMKANPKRQS